MDSPNYVEFSIKKKEDAATHLKRALIFLGSIAPAFIASAVLLAVGGPFIVLTAPIMMLTIAFCVYSRRFTRLEYEYIIQSGELNVAVIYDNKSRRNLIKDAKISEMQKVAPYHGNEQLLESRDIDRVLYYCSDLEHPDLYIAVFSDAKKGRTGLVFNASRKLVQIMKFYNSLNVTVKSDFLI